MIMESVLCNLCGCDQFDMFLVRKDLSLFIPGDFRLVRCKQCGLVYLNPRPAPESISEIYPDEYDQYTPTSPAASQWRRLISDYGVIKRAHAILNYKQTGRLLDVGCATGVFLDRMRQSPGWDIYGVEVSATASEYARRVFKLNVMTGSLEDASFPPRYFDVITMWNVLEHLPDPVKSLMRINKLLKPDGLLVFNTPNLDCLDAHFFGPNWIGFEIPRHFYIYSQATLMQTLLKAGFKIINRRCLYGTHASTMSSIRFWLRTISIPPKRRARLENFLFSFPARVITAPYFFLVDQLKQSTTPTDFCVKIRP